MKRLVLCADDYALAPGVSRAIRELASQGHLNATSVMTPGPDLGREADALLAIRPSGFQIGLHLTLTGGLAPLTPGHGGRFPSLPWLMARASARHLPRAAILAEIEAQFDAFETAFGSAPDFVDGHQHVHLLPVIRTMVLSQTRKRAAHAWVRQCGGPSGSGDGIKASIISTLSAGLAREAPALGLSTNSAFSGAYDFRRSSEFPTLFPGFLANQPEGLVVMVHPGHVDEKLRSVDPLLGPREDELRYLASDQCRIAIAASGFRL